MTKQEFNKKVKEKIKEYLETDADMMAFKMENQKLYRNYGIEGMTFLELLNEMAKADILGISFVDNLSEEMIIAMAEEL